MGIQVRNQGGLCACGQEGCMWMWGLQIAWVTPDRSG
jgi:hypothetical protein